jgi:hypothetical protein
MSLDDRIGHLLMKDGLPRGSVLGGYVGLGLGSTVALGQMLTNPELKHMGTIDRVKLAAPAVLGGTITGAALGSRYARAGSKLNPY